MQKIMKACYWLTIGNAFLGVYMTSIGRITFGHCVALGLAGILSLHLLLIQRKADEANTADSRC